jgi:hypothetical protein
LKALVAEVEDEGGRLATQRLDELVMPVDVPEAIAFERLQGSAEPIDGVDVLGVEPAVALDGVGQRGVAEQDRDLGERQGPPFRCRHLPCLGPDDHAMGHHPEVLAAVRTGLGTLAHLDVLVARALEPPLDTRRVIETLRVELIGDDAALGVYDHLPGDQPLCIPREGALPAHEVVLVDPLPRARLEVVALPVAVGQIEQQRSVCPEGAGGGAQHRQVIAVLLEVSE